MDLYVTTNGDIVKSPADWKKENLEYGENLADIHLNYEFKEAKNIREILCYYFNFVSPVAW